MFNINTLLTLILLWFIYFHLFAFSSWIILIFGILFLILRCCHRCLHSFLDSFFSLCTYNTICSTTLPWNRYLIASLYLFLRPISLSLSGFDQTHFICSYIFLVCFSSLITHANKTHDILKKKEEWMSQSQNKVFVLRCSVFLCA